MASVLDDLGLGDTHPSQQSVAGDPAVWTLLGEAGLNREGWLPVASTIHNRAKKVNVDYGNIVTDPTQGYEAWQDPVTRQKIQQQFPIDSPQYKEASEFLGELKSGKIAPLKYDAFYSPNGQAAKNRPPPSFENGKGTDIAGNRFFDTSGKYASVLDDLGLNDHLAEPSSAPASDQPDTPPVAVPHIEGANGRIVFSDSKLPLPEKQAASIRALNESGNLDVSKPPGDAFAPIVQRNPKDTFKPGQFYIDPTGVMHKTPGGPEDKSEFGERFGEGAYAGSGDVPLSLMKLLPGHKDSDLYNSFTGQQLLYNAEHEGDKAAQAGRFTGQMLTTAPFLGGPSASQAVLSRFGLPQVGEFLAGKLGGNAIIRGGSLVARGATQGAETAALTSGSSRDSLDHQIEEGAIAGAVANPVLHSAGSYVASKIAPSVSPILSDLADKAVNKFGINLRVPQILGAEDTGHALLDQRLLKAPGSGFAKSAAEQPLQFTKAVAGTFGVSPDEVSNGLTPSVMSNAKDRIGNVMNSYAANQEVTGANLGDLISELTTMKSDIRASLQKDQADPLIENIHRIMRDARKGTYSGTSYRDMITTGQPFDRLQDSGNSTTRYYAGKVRDALDNAFEKSYDPKTGGTPLETFQEARLHYKNLMTAKEAIDNNKLIDPNALDQAVDRKFKGRAFSGAGDLGDLADIGQLFMRGKGAPPSHGPFLPALAGGALGSIFTGGEGLALYLHNPALAAKIAAGTGGLMASRYLGNSIRGAVNNNSFLRNQIISGTPPTVSPFAKYVADKFAVPATTIGTSNLFQTQGNK